MPWVPRYIRRLWQRGTNRYTFLNIFCLILLIATFSFVVAQVTTNRRIKPDYKENLRPAPMFGGLNRHNDPDHQRPLDFDEPRQALPNDFGERDDEPRVHRPVEPHDIPAPDLVDPPRRERRPEDSAVFQRRIGGSARKEIDGQDYPQMTPDGKFVPIRRWVHFDLKGAPFKVPYFLELFPFMKRVGITGILLEWEDMFPFKGRLASAVNGNAYTMDQVHKILEAANQAKLDVIPLVQTFGHLEWVLKLKEFVHLREDTKYPQVICFGSPDAWSLIQDMVDQVAEVHQKYGMRFFHMGADEAFQVGVCNATVKEMRQQGGRDRVMLWHLSRTAKYIKDKYKVTVLAWHDMFAHVMEQDLLAYRLPEVLEPVLWSYAEDLDMYLPYSTWVALRPFRNVWGASAFKGADGPMRFNSNPIHYIRNHLSWTVQMTRVYKDFEYFQGLIVTGWSRYDHLAVLCELFPVGVPALAMGVETIMTGRPVYGTYPKTNALLQCTVPYEQGYVLGCQFPGHRVYELVNEFSALRDQIQKYISSDFDFNGWMSVLIKRYKFSSPMYIEKVLPQLEYYLGPLEQIESNLRTELGRIFFDDAVDEFVLTYMSQELGELRDRLGAAKAILHKSKAIFAKRPFVKFPAEKPHVSISDNTFRLP